MNSPHQATPAAAVPLEEIVQSLRHPPCAPKVIPLLKRHLANLNSSIQQIVDLIRLDPGIAARVLQAANSAVFSRGDRCHSVEVAVNRIGFDNIFDIVANAVAEQVLVRPLEAYAIEADDLWRRSVACGIAAETLARLRDEDVNVAYTLGLLHAVGMVAIDQWAQKNAPTMGFFGRGFPREHIDGERALLGWNNAEVGASVLRSWEFPPEMSDPLRWQYEPLGTTAYRRLNCILYAARWLSARVNAEHGHTITPPDDRLLAPIKFTAATLEKLVPVVRDRMDHVQRSLEDPQPGEAA